MNDTEHELQIANIYRSHARVLQYMLKRGKNDSESIEQLADTWLGCAEQIEKNLLNG